MLKYKYKIDTGEFSSLKEFENYLNRMGDKGYELVQADTSFIGSENIHKCIIWKIENHEL